MVLGNRLFGMLRSLAIYHGIPLRQKKLRAFYREFLSSGDLTFDLGAHVGNRTRALLGIGCQVVAIEPQPDFARLLRAMFTFSSQVKIVETAVTNSVGRSILSVSDRTPTMTTLTSEWREARTNEKTFSNIRWNRPVNVNTTTLDELIQQFGVPEFVKIDVEGAEPMVLAGLSHPISVMSFEYLPQELNRVQKCIEHLSTLGNYRYNWSPGETYRLAGDSWMNGHELLSALDAQTRSGDVYARHYQG